MISHNLSHYLNQCNFILSHYEKTKQKVINNDILIKSILFI